MAITFVRRKFNRQHRSWGKRRLASHVVRAKIEKERQCVGGAFGIVRWSSLVRWSEAHFGMDFKGYNRDEMSIYIRINGTSQRLSSVAVPLGEREAYCWFDFDNEQLSIREGAFDSDCPACSVVLAHGLYHLGFDDEKVWSRLNISLSNHEKLELRLSMPREFWPKRWLDEEAQQSS